MDNSTGEEKTKSERLHQGRNKKGLNGSSNEKKLQVLVITIITTINSRNNFQLMAGSFHHFITRTSKNSQIGISASALKFLAPLSFSDKRTSALEKIFPSPTRHSRKNTLHNRIRRESRRSPLINTKTTTKCPFLKCLRGGRPRAINRPANWESANCLN